MTHTRLAAVDAGLAVAIPARLARQPSAGSRPRLIICRASGARCPNNGRLALGTPSSRSAFFSPGFSQHLARVMPTTDADIHALRDNRPNRSADISWNSKELLETSDQAPVRLIFYPSPWSASPEYSLGIRKKYLPGPLLGRFSSLSARRSQGRNDPEAPSGVPEVVGPRIDAEASWISNRGRSYGRRSPVISIFLSA